MASELKTARHGRTLVLTLSDPATRNTLSEQLVAAGIEALNVAESEDQVRAVVVCGEGGHFCAGGNVRGLAARRQAGPAAQVETLERLHRLVEAIRVFPKPVIAAVEGAAAGAGFSLALACDLMVAAEDARFVLSYARLGLTPDGGASWHLARAVPRPLVQQWLWLAEPIGTRQLHAHGLVNRVAEPGRALDEALALAAQLAQMAPQALAGAKALVQQASGAGLAAQLAAERDLFVETLFHANGGEGLQAFLDKRPPQFR